MTILLCYPSFKEIISHTYEEKIIPNPNIYTEFTPHVLESSNNVINDQNSIRNNFNLNREGNQLYFTAMDLIRTTDLPNLVSNETYNPQFKFEKLKSGIITLKVKDLDYPSDSKIKARINNQKLIYSTISQVYLTKDLSILRNQTFYPIYPTITPCFLPTTSYCFTIKNYDEIITFGTEIIPKGMKYFSQYYQETGTFLEYFLVSAFKTPQELIKDNISFFPIVSKPFLQDEEVAFVKNLHIIYTKAEPDYSIFQKLREKIANLYKSEGFDTVAPSKYYIILSMYRGKRMKLPKYRYDRIFDIIDTIEEKYSIKFEKLENDMNISNITYYAKLFNQAKIVASVTDPMLYYMIFMQENTAVCELIPYKDFTEFIYLSQVFNLHYFVARDINFKLGDYGFEINAETFYKMIKHAAIFFDH